MNQRAIHESPLHIWEIFQIVNQFDCGDMIIPKMGYILSQFVPKIGNIYLAKLHGRFVNRPYR